MNVRRRPWLTKYDGLAKDYTSDCSSCPFYRRFENSELCGVGVAFKYLEHGGNDSKRCKVKDIIPERGDGDRSIHYLDHFISTRGLTHRGFSTHFTKET